MEDVAINSIVRVEYTGQIEMEKGPFKGKLAHTVDVAIAEGSDMVVEEADLPEEAEDEEDYGL